MPKTPKKTEPAAEAKYPKLTALWRVGDKAMKFEEAKKLLGWREDTAEEKFTDFDMELPNGRRVIFDNNTRNRIWRPLQLKVLKQDHLNKRFRFNPDGFGIGTSGQIISCQHRLRSFCEAELERQADPEKWGHEPLTMECIVVLGMDESDETFRILNLTTPANAADAFYRQRLFPKHVKSNRAKLCTMLEQAIKCAWVRTGVNKDGYAPLQTNAEIVDWYERHPKLADCVTHIFESYSSGPGHASRMGAGPAATLMYLMGCSATDPKKVAKYKEKPSDKALDWSLFDKAHDFWTEVCRPDDKIEPGFGQLRDYLNTLADPDNLLGGLYERKLAVTKAWNLYRNGDPVTLEGVTLSVTVGTDAHGSEVRELNEHPDLGGIDCNEREGQVEGESADTPVTPEEVEEAKAEVQETKTEPVPEPETDPIEEEKRKVTELRVAHRNKVLLFVVKNTVIVVNEDAKLFHRLFKLPIKEGHGKEYIEMPMKTRHTWLASLKAAKKRAVWVKDNGDTVEEAV